ILIAEDSPEDAALLVRELRHAGFDPRWKRVEREPDFLAELDNSPDLILSDYSMPQFSGLRAMELMRERGLDIPFILISGTIGEEASVEAMKHGATDYLLKDRLARLGSAVERAMEQKSLREERRQTTEVFQEEHRQAEEKLRESELKLRQLAEHISQVFWISDKAKHEILYVSPAYEKIWERSCESLYQSPGSWLETIHPEDREGVQRAVASKQERGDYDEIYRITRLDGSVRWIRDRAFPVRNEAGEVCRVVGTAEDITERKQLEEQFRQAQKMEAIGQLAGGVAHDFNNILTSMLMQIDLAAMDGNLSKEVRENLRQIRADAGRAAGLTRQLLLFSRRQVMQSRDIDLNEVVINLTKMLRRIIGEDMRLQLNLHPAPLVTHADAGMLEQVLMNLAVNARDAMPEGGRLMVKTSAHTVEATPAPNQPDAGPGNYVCLSVSDNGCGIPADALPRIFEPFFTTKEPGKGTGLGLATVFGIVKQHRGWITVDTQPGKGTTFQVYLPARDVSAAPVARPPGPKPRGGTETILLVEDDASVRKSTQILLARSGYQVLEAANGVGALKIWGENGAAVALLLTDLVMPAGLSGRQLARRLQAERPGLKVIYFSGYSAEIAGREFKLLDGENFLQKPIRPEDLLNAVRKSLDG
ncbi:MAG TPA: response regulator, partial [Candidatus Acidoferrales bacterium]|nr:response regulator [Candidatus Acidoferrales bacterium]